ncbi:MAG: ABC transporter permease [Candidatus Azobacteroides sp.]|nr:ABC transporter permease [Candidatus Azobacteroides sp.]
MKSFKNKQLYQLTFTQILETIREPEVLFWGIIFPVLISIGLGLAFTQDSETKFRVVIIEKSPARLDSLLSVYASTETDKQVETHIWKIADKTLGNTVFRFIHNDWKAGIVSLKRGEADLLVSDSLEVTRYHFDPHNSQSQLAYLKLSALLQSPVSSQQISSTDIEPLRLKGVRYIDFLVPGLIAMGIMSSIMWGVSYTLIERRSQKLLRRMVATPMKKSYFIFAMMFVRIIMNFIEAGIIFFAAALLFGIEIQGNIGALMFLFLAGNIAFTGIAVLVSCKTSKTEVGTGWINAVQMPMMILSGVFFSYHNFPSWSIPVIKLLPLTALADGMRSIFNEGAGWMEILSPSIALSAFGFICFAIGMKLFKWY